MTLQASTNRPLAARRARIEMITRGLSVRALANEIGFSAKHVANVLSGGAKSWPVKSAINRYFGELIFARPARIHKPSPPQKYV
jgi:lambda repressor-like predicted transcriptional regulator